MLTWRHAAATSPGWFSNMLCLGGGLVRVSISVAGSQHGNNHTSVCLRHAFVCSLVLRWSEGFSPRKQPLLRFATEANTRLALIAWPVLVSSATDFYR